MKKVLFVIPDYQLSGTNSSLIALLNHSGELDIRPSVYALFDYGPLKGDFCCELLKSDPMLAASYGNLKAEVGPLRKAFFLLVKGLKKINLMLGTGDRFILRTITRAFSRIDLAGYDYIVAFQEGNPTYLVSALDHGRKIAWIHGAYERDPSGSAIELPVYSKFWKVVCVSEYSKKMFTQIFPALADRVDVVLNYFDYERVNSLKNSPLHSDAMDCSCYRIISLGRIGPVKRFHLIPEIAHILVERGLAFKWFLCGPPNGKNEYKRILDGIRRYSLEDVVILLGAQVNPYPFLYHSDLFVSLSRSEATPMVFMEARVCGLPIVSADFATAIDNLKDYEFGFVSAVEGIPDLVEKLYRSRIKPGTDDVGYYKRYNADISSSIRRLLCE